MAKTSALPKSVFRYGGDEILQEQLQKLGLEWTPEKLRERIRATVLGEAVVTPTELMAEIAGPKMEDDNLSDPVAAQAFALNFLALWNEELEKRPAGEGTDAWRTQMQGRIEEEAREARKPYIAPVRPGRNDPCDCGSGKKYKRCHGAA